MAGAVHEQEVAAAGMGRMEAGGAAIGRIKRELAAMDKDIRDGRTVILATGQGGIVRFRARGLIVDHFLAGNDAGPDALHETAVALTDSDRVGRAVGYIG